MWLFILNLLKRIFGHKVRYATKNRFTPGGGGNVYSLGVSRDGTKLVAGQNGGAIFKSVDSGVTWTKTNSPGTPSWNKVAISNDGNYIFAQPNSNYIYVSSDGGNSYTQKTSGLNQDNDGLAMSATGQYGYLAGFAFATSYVSVTTDFGATWTQKTAPGSVAKHAIACSSNGQYVVVGNVNTSFVYTSSDFGANWTQRSGAGQRTWYGANISDDGTKIALGGYNVGIFTSTDSGANWTQRASNNYWTMLVGNSDGTKLFAAGSQTANSGIFEFWTSNDSGVNWTNRSSAIGNLQDNYGQQSNGAIACDSSGNLYVAVNRQFMSKSTDNGASWTQLDNGFDFGKQFALQVVSGSGQVGFASEYSPSKTHISTDGLQTWTPTPNMRRTVLACSYDGSKVLATVATTTVYSSGTATIYPAISTDTGQTWSDKTSAPVKEYGDGCMSDDGTTMFLMGVNNLARSTDTGATWSTLSTALAANNYWGDITCSSTGAKVYAVDGTPGYIYTSTDSGTNFTQRTGAGSRAWAGVACSADGSIVYAVADSTLMYKSTDSGVTWNTLANSSNKSWFGVICSDNGQRIIGFYYDSVAVNVPIVCSFDGGTTWTTLYTVSSDTEYSVGLVGGNSTLRKIAYGVSSMKSGDLVEPKLSFML